jgi:predicted ATPase/DNA-binding CsgD family transcriptional regulator
MSNQGRSNGNQAASLQSLARLSQPAAPDTAFVGRTRELAAIENDFEDQSCHLISLVGLGGIGKTRIAWEVGTRLVEKFPRGVHFVSLAAIATPDLIVPTIAAAIGFTFQGSEPPQIQLIRHLSSRDMLLILDNFEHLINGGADLIAEILQDAPGARLLITSRERLNLREEWVIDVHGLDYPAGHIDAENFSAVQLFLQHARRVKGDFQLTDANRADVIRICRLVEGMPLALELAAAWARALSCRAIGDEIARSLDLLTTNLRDMPEKHRSMRAVFSRSYGLLTAEQQQMFAKLSVFRGGFEREAAEAVTGASLTILAEFVDKSLLSISGEGRYSIHELLRQYGEEQLETSGIGDDVRDAHSACYADFLDQRVEDLKGRRQVAALVEIRSDFENIRTAWNWAAATKSESRLDYMLEGLWLYCSLDNRIQEGAMMMRDAKQQLASGYRSEPLWGRLLSRAMDKEDTLGELEIALQIANRQHNLAEVGFCLNQLASTAYARGEFAKTKQFLDQSLEIYRQRGDRFYIAKTLFDLQSHHYEGSWDDFIRYGGESYRLSHEIGDRVGAAWSVSAVAMEHGREGRFMQAERLWLERIELGYETGNLVLAASGKGHISHKIYFVLGDFDKARATAEDSLRIAQALGESNRGSLGWALADLGLLACMDENYQEAKHLFQQAVPARWTMWTADLANWGLSMASCGLGDYEAARQYLSKVFGFLAKIHGRVGIVQYVAVAAIILAHRGNPARAVELLALAFTHPVGASGWMEKWPLLTRLRAHLERTLGAETYAAAWERGARLDLETTAAELQARFTAKASASQPLEDPLTERELEVLRLLAAGLSNQDIADRLVISLGTVKSHTANIYGKLGVNNRVQAIVEAKKLGLL